MDWRRLTREFNRRAWSLTIEPGWMLDPDIGTIGQRFIVDDQPGDETAPVEVRVVYHDELADESRDALLDAVLARCREIDPSFG